MVAGLPTNGTTVSPLVFQISDSVRLKKFKQMSPLRASLTETVVRFRTVAIERWRRSGWQELTQPNTSFQGHQH